MTLRTPGPVATCARAARSVGGVCVCPPGLTDCAGTCRDLATDVQNCGRAATCSRAARSVGRRLRLPARVDRVRRYAATWPPTSGIAGRAATYYGRQCCQGGVWSARPGSPTAPVPAATWPSTPELRYAARCDGRQRLLQRAGKTSPPMAELRKLRPNLPGVVLGRPTLRQRKLHDPVAFPVYVMTPQGRGRHAHRYPRSRRWKRPPCPTAVARTQGRRPTTTEWVLGADLVQGRPVRSTLGPSLSQSDWVSCTQWKT